MIDLKLDVPDLSIDWLTTPSRLKLTSKSEVVEVTATEALEDILGTNGVAYAVVGVESVPFELYFVFNSLYHQEQLLSIGKALSDYLTTKGISVKFNGYG